MDKIIEVMVSLIFAILIFAVLAEAIVFIITTMGLPGTAIAVIIGIIWADHNRKK